MHARSTALSAIRPQKLAAASALLRRVLLAAALTTLCAPVPALAADGADAAQTFASAQKLYDSGDYAGALPLFRDVLKSSGSPNARLYVARCLRELGKLPEAYDEMEATQREATSRANAEPKYAATRDASAAERAVLESRIGRLIIAIPDPPPDVVVTLNGAPFPLDKLGTPTSVTPGAMLMTAEAPGGTKIQRRIIVAAGETKTVALTLSGEPQVTETREVPSPPPIQTTGGGVRTAGYFVSGLGVAGFGLLGVAWGLAESKYRSTEKECGTDGSKCTEARYNELVSGGKTLDTLSKVGLIAGIAGVTAGAAMILFGGPSRTPSATATLAVSPAGATLGCRGAF